MDIFLRIVIWLSWVFFILLNLSSAKYLTNHDGNIDPTRFPHGFIQPAVLVILSIAIAGGLRWWISRIHTLWLKLMPIWLGLFSACLTQYFGIYIEPGHELLFQVLSDFVLLAYFPLFLTDKWSLKPAAPPPIPPQ